MHSLSRRLRGWRKITAARWHPFLAMQGRVARRIPVLLTVPQQRGRHPQGVQHPRRTSGNDSLGVDRAVSTPPEPRREPATTVECPVALSAWRADAPLKGSLLPVGGDREGRRRAPRRIDSRLEAGPGRTVGTAHRAAVDREQRPCRQRPRRRGARRLARQCPDRRRAVAVRGLLIAGRRGDELRYAADRDACRGDPRGGR